jgi:predicted PurR-regulated permease PerM
VVAVGIVYGTLAVGAGLPLLALTGPLLRNVEHVAEDIGELHRHIDQNWRDGNAFHRYVVELLPPVEQPLEPVAGIDGATLLQGISGIGVSLFGLVIAAFLAIVVGIYWSADYYRIERLWLLLFPLQYRIPARQIWRQVQAEVGTYMRSELLQAVLAGVVLGLAFFWSGFPYPVAMAMLVAATWLVPWLGPLLAVAAIWAASMLNFMEVTPAANMARGIICSGFAILVFVVLEFYVEPKLYDQRRYSSLLVLVTTLVVLQLVGVVALLLAPPLTIAIQILAGRLLSCPSPAAPCGRPADLPSLEERLADIQSSLDEAETGCPRQLKGIIGSLTELLSDSRAMIDSASSPNRPIES